MNIQKHIAIDLETTDLDPSIGEIIEIGAVVVNHDLSIGEAFQAYIKPSTDYRNPRAMEVNGISEEKLSTAPDFSEAMMKFGTFVSMELGTHGPKTVSAWNVSFDVPFLKAMCKKFNCEYPFSYSPICLKSMAIIKAAECDTCFIGGLCDILELHGLSFEGTAHSALDDIKNSIKALQKFYE